MAKYSFEFKRNIVMEYLSGQGGYECLEKGSVKFFSQIYLPSV